MHFGGPKYAGYFKGFPVSIATRCKKLRNLEIRGLTLGAVPKELGRLTNLTRLDLENCEVGSA